MRRLKTIVDGKFYQFEKVEENLGAEFLVGFTDTQGNYHEENRIYLNVADSKQIFKTWLKPSTEINVNQIWLHIQTSEKEIFYKYVNYPEYGINQITATIADYTKVIKVHTIKF